ncbi:universal stress protein [Pseudohalioglobus lutimaris]|uniref:Universal stress protein n=1 Tax=Pseudohalioglobus lutimaris TaxID=1737061 RepID=A0A2N5WWT3_9GAMM|nr:universal stress protein [Pseudohalioglobus lutimaris]PLW66697.1 universal stress protein [Pseudohalioglobus lutimaris]
MGKILVIADITGRCGATPRGLELADKLGLDADVVAFVYAPLGKLEVDTAARSAIKQRLLSQRETELQSVIDKYQVSGQKVKLRVHWEKDIVDWVNKRCASTAYEMVVKTGRRSETLAYASSDWLLLRECPVPLLILASNKWSRTAPVMAALDLASSIAAKKQLNDRVLGQAKALAEAMGEKLEIICAVEVPALLQELDLVDPIAYVKRARSDMEPVIRKLAKRHGIPEKAFHTKRGPVEKVIASQAAAKRAQIVVMGTVGRKGVKARLIGNTAEKVLTHLKTDVLAIKP